MKFLVAVPDHKYYIWQVLVQINNFKRLNIERDTTYVFGIFNNRPSRTLLSLINSKKISAKFVLINDQRIDKGYTSSLRPYILDKYYKEFAPQSTEAIFYLDPDVLFTKPIDFTQFERDNIWYVSDTRSYIDSKYIKSKSPELFQRMCDVVNISPIIVEANDGNAGGAQYIMKNVPIGYWEKVYKDSEALFKLMKSTETVYHPEHPIQSWTADMWAVLWNAWYFGNEVKIDKELDFCWASESIERWNKTNIFHNAGVVTDDGKHFSKTHYQISPFNKETKGSPESASWNYIGEIKRTEKNFPELMF